MIMLKIERTLCHFGDLESGYSDRRNADLGSASR
jgi:hypothetical protein